MTDKLSKVLESLILISGIVIGSLNIENRKDGCPIYESTIVAIFGGMLIYYLFKNGFKRKTIILMILVTALYALSMTVWEKTIAQDARAASHEMWWVNVAFLGIYVFAILVLAFFFYGDRNTFLDEVLTEKIWGAFGAGSDGAVVKLKHPDDLTCKELKRIFGITAKKETLTAQYVHNKVQDKLIKLDRRDASDDIRSYHLQAYSKLREKLCVPPRGDMGGGVGGDEAFYIPRVAGVEDEGPSRMAPRRSRPEKEATWAGYEKEQERTKSATQKRPTRPAPHVLDVYDTVPFETTQLSRDLPARTSDNRENVSNDLQSAFFPNPNLTRRAGTMAIATI